MCSSLLMCVQGHVSVHVEAIEPLNVSIQVLPLIGLKLTIRQGLLASKPQESPYLHLHSPKIPCPESSHLLT